MTPQVGEYSMLSPVINCQKDCNPIEQYKTFANLGNRQDFNSFPKENPKGVMDYLPSVYREIDFVNIPGDTLEIGAGNGMLWELGGKELVREFTKQGRLIITDTSDNGPSSMLGKCRNLPVLKEIDGIEIKYADGNKLPFEDNTFSKMIGNFVLYYIPDSLGELIRVLKTDGEAIFVVPNSDYHLVEIYTLFGDTFERYNNKNYEKLELEFPKRAPAIQPFCAPEGEEKLKKYFEIVEKRAFPNNVIITEKHPTKDLTGPKAIVNYTCSLSFTQELIKKGVLNDDFFNEMHAIVEEKIKQDGAFKVGRNDVLYHCKKPKKQTLG